MRVVWDRVFRWVVDGSGATDMSLVLHRWSCDTLLHPWSCIIIILVLCIIIILVKLFCIIIILVNVE